MTRSGSLILCAMLGNALLACGSNTSTTASPDAARKNPLDFVPVDNDVPGWTVDQALSKSPGERAMTGDSYQKVTDLIDGGVGDFYFGSYAPTEFLWQNYKNLSLSAAPPPDGAVMALYILEMPSADDASGLYKGILKFSDHKSSAGTAWQDPASSSLAAAESRIQDTGNAWWINFRQGAYYVEILLNPSAGPDFVPGNEETKAQAFLFAQNILSKMKM